MKKLLLRFEVAFRALFDREYLFLSYPHGLHEGENETCVITVADSFVLDQIANALPTILVEHK